MVSLRLSLVCLAAIIAPALPAAYAQEFTEPRFEALELQLHNLNQREYDRLERERQDARDRTLFPPPGQTQADAVIRLLEAERRQENFRLQYEQERMREQRQRDISDMSIASRRIAPSSTLVVRDPASYGLPPASRDQYYARVQGRFVLVDAASELVTQILPPAPAEPRGDELPQPRAPLNTPIVAPDRLPPQSVIGSPPAMLGGAARDPLNPDLNRNVYQPACLAGGRPNPNATNPIAARYCPEPKR